jgi:hypothetical protein
MTAVDARQPEQSRTNAPESEALALQDVAIFDAARSAVTLLKKTLATWLMIGEAVVRAREIADRRGGRKTFMRLIEQQGLSKIVDKATASRLLRIMENRIEVERWHQSLNEDQQVRWASPTAVFKHCPIFAIEKPEGERKPSPYAQLKEEHVKALQENYQLKQREDGDSFKPSDKADDIAIAIIGMLETKPGKAIQVAKLILDKLNRKTETID